MAIPNPTLTHFPKSSSSPMPATAPPPPSSYRSPAPFFFHNHNHLTKPHPPSPLSLNTPHPHLISLPPPPLSFRNRRLPLFSFAHDSSKPSDDKLKGHLGEEDGAEESQREKAWKETLASFKTQALKLQAVSQEAYEVYSKKAIVILNETSQKLKIQADKARQDLTVIAKEIAQDSKEYLANAADNSPEPVKDIVVTFASSADELNEVSELRDFYIGIPYGAFLSACGFLSFMISGSLSALRFGVILGGALLALSISSLRSWKKREPSSPALKGQAAISTILFLREVRLLFSRPYIGNFISVFVSGAVVAFYAYRIVMDREQATGSNLEGEREN